jgi:3-phenylpropionate/cinnamic acid dioxygenase small subunit
VRTDDIELHLEVHQLLARYAHGVDRGDLAMAQSVFWPDAVDHHGGHWHGNAHAYMADLIGRQDAARVAGQRGGFQHHFTSVLIERTGDDTARVVAAFLAFILYQRDGEDRVALLSGRFLDEVQRRDGVWRVAARTVVNDFSTDNARGEPYGPGSWQSGGYLAGRYGFDDPARVFLSGAPIAAVD